MVKPNSNAKQVKEGQDLFLEVLHEPGKDDSAKLQMTSFITRNQELVNKLKVEAKSATLVATQQSVSTFGTTVGSLTEDNSRLLRQTEVPEVLAILGPDASDVFKDPYDLIDKIRIHETWREDGNFAAAIDFLMQFVLGEHFSTIIDVNSELDNESDTQLMLEHITSNKQIKAYKKQIDKITRKVNFTENLRAFFTQYLVFGRACMIVERDPTTELPIALKVLPSMSLGQIYVHRKTWEMLGIEFLDFQFPQSILKKDEIIYASFHDYNVSASTKHYGYALTERILHLSELNRIITQRNLKEANYRLWAPVYLIKSMNAINPATMDKLRDQIANGAGNSIATNQNVDVTIEHLEVDPEPLTKERADNNLEIRRQLQIPEILFDPKTLNRATSDELMQAFIVTVATMYRRIIIDVIQRQWINPILTTLVKNGGRPELADILSLQQEQVLKDEEAQEEQEIKTQEMKEEKEAEEERQIKHVRTLAGAELEKPNPNIGKNEPFANQEEEEEDKDLAEGEDGEEEALDPNDPDYDVEDEKWKIKAELEEINLDTPIEKTASAIKLYQAGMITLEKALKMIGMDDEIENILLEKEKHKQQMREQGIVPFGDPGNNPINNNASTKQSVPGQGSDNNGELGQKKTTIDRKLDSFKTSPLLE